MISSMLTQEEINTIMERALETACKMAWIPNQVWYFPD